MGLTFTNLFLMFFCDELIIFKTTFSVILLLVLMILLSTQNLTELLICGNSLSWSPRLNLTFKTLWAGLETGLEILIHKKLNVFHLTNHITGVINVQVDAYVFDGESSFKMVEFFPLDWTGLLVSITTTASKEIGILTFLFLSSEAVRYLKKCVV